ncbi:MAG: protein-glutamine glutaminase family protein, partial [Pseudomonadota bacterium]
MIYSTFVDSHLENVLRFRCIFMGRSLFITLISLTFSTPGIANESCDQIPACDRPPIFQDLRDRGELVDDRAIQFNPVQSFLSIFSGSEEPDDDCPPEMKDQHTSEDSGVPASEVLAGHPNSDVQNISAISLERAQQLFASLKDDCRIPYEMNTDGCYPRAHAMAKLAEDQGIIVAKAFFAGHSPRELELQNPISGQYHYPDDHAAITVAVRGPDGSVRPFIIDPSAADGPMPLDAYKRSISMYDNPRSVLVQFASRFRDGRSDNYQQGVAYDEPLTGWGSGAATVNEDFLNSYRIIQEHLRSDNPNKCNCIARETNRWIYP